MLACETVLESTVAADNGTFKCADPQCSMYANVSMGYMGVYGLVPKLVEYTVPQKAP